LGLIGPLHSRFTNHSGASIGAELEEDRNGWVTGAAAVKGLLVDAVSSKSECVEDVISESGAAATAGLLSDMRD